MSADQRSRQDQNKTESRDFDEEKRYGELCRVEKNMLVMVLTEKGSSIEYYV